MPNVLSHDVANGPTVNCSALWVLAVAPACQRTSLRLHELPTTAILHTCTCTGRGEGSGGGSKEQHQGDMTQRGGERAQSSGVEGPRPNKEGRATNNHTNRYPGSTAKTRREERTKQRHQGRTGQQGGEKAAVNPEQMEVNKTQQR